MIKMQTQEGYKQIVYDANEFGIITEKTLKCVMCKKPAFFIADETNEPLCPHCKGNNDEARMRRGTPRWG